MSGINANFGNLNNVNYTRGPQRKKNEEVKEEKPAIEEKKPEELQPEENKKIDLNQDPNAAYREMEMTLKRKRPKKNNGLSTNGEILCEPEDIKPILQDNVERTPLNMRYLGE